MSDVSSGEPEGRPIIYMDHAATTPVRPEVVEAMRPYFEGDFGNPSSLHSAGRRARDAVERSRERIAHALGCKPIEVVFTSGGTEADNLALLGAAAAWARDRGTAGASTGTARRGWSVTPSSTPSRARKPR